MLFRSNWKYFIPWAGRFLDTGDAASRTDENSRLAHLDLLAKAKTGRIDIYFEGDSITRRWRATDYPELLANWKQNFFGWNAADFGWGADTTRNILWRLENGELNGVNPKVIVLLAGTNDLTDPAAAASDPIANVTRRIRTILRVIEAKAPEATVILMGIFPRNDDWKLLPLIEKINANLSELADGKRIRYLNINEKLADRDGRLFAGMMNERDKLHPALKGYQVWADALKPLFTELLGPPAKEDYAPGPTGDPRTQH